MDEFLFQFQQRQCFDKVAITATACGAAYLTLFAARVEPLRGAVQDAGRAVVPATTSDPQRRNAPRSGSALRVAARKCVCGVAALGKGMAIAGAPRLASIAFWPQRARQIKSDRLPSPCSTGTNVLVYPEGIMYGGVTKDDISAIFDEHLLGDMPVERLKVPADLW